MKRILQQGAVALALSALCSLAQSQVAVVVGQSGPTLTKDQVVNLYLGRVFDFKPLDLPASSAIHEDFYRKATERDAPQIKAVWARIVFTGKGQPPQILPDAAAVKKAVNADSKTVGYIAKSDVDSSVKVLLTLD